MERKLAFGMNDPNWARAMVEFAKKSLGKKTWTILSQVKRCHQD
jgi:hypothetical protein